MTTFLFYLLMTALLLIIQTFLCIDVLLSYHFFNLMTPFVTYIGLFRPSSEGIPAVICIGLIMDAVTGGPFGLYLIIYFWLYIGAKWGIQYFHAGSVLLMPFIIGAGVLGENAVTLFSSVVMGIGGRIPTEEVVRSVTIQTAWAMIAGPFLLHFFHRLQTRLAGWQLDRSPGRQDYLG
ncbi:MAG: hypothetical protein ACOZF0_02155 [Thermodesulfobacteriota bacterium]